MTTTRWSLVLTIPFVLGLAGPMAGQGKGAERGKSGEKKSQATAKHGAATQPPQARGTSTGKGKAEDKTVGQSRPEKASGRAVAEARKGAEHVSTGEVKRANPPAAASGRGRSRFVRDVAFDDLTPSSRRFVASDRPEERLVGKAVANAHARGLRDDEVLIVPSGTRMIVRNRAGDVLVDMDNARARSLGSWTAVTVSDRVKDDAPAFCRSGAGHPVWGRQWCLDKGFGLGVENDVRWSRTLDPGDIVFRETTSGSLTRDVLQRVLGDVVLNRLAMHALTLGFADPLTGTWMGETTGPRVLLVTSGGRPVAEIVDANRDNRAENLLVALRPW
jgi:hypothetical protein